MEKQNIKISTKKLLENLKRENIEIKFANKVTKIISPLLNKYKNKAIAKINKKIYNEMDFEDYEFVVEETNKRLKFKKKIKELEKNFLKEKKIKVSSEFIIRREDYYFCEKENRHCIDYKIDFLLNFIEEKKINGKTIEIETKNKLIFIINVSNKKIKGFEKVNYKLINIKKELSQFKKTQKLINESKKEKAKLNLFTIKYIIN